jgi:hypothetical protein
MDGEFRVEIKAYDATKIVQAFVEHYGNKLAEVYSKSAYQSTGTLGPDDFCAGYQTNDSLFLVYNREGNDLKVYIEPANKRDINLMKTFVNRYFKGITDMLDKKTIKWSKPQATITLEGCPLTGVYTTKAEAFKEILRDQKEKVLFTPIGAFLAVGGARYLSIMEKGDVSKEVEKIVTSGLEALVVVALMVVFQVLIVSNKRAFTFKI